ncbi:acetyl-CoA carboxylase carboxyltransferase subunit alpha [Desulfotomaculum copahuensis]|uniref:Acetyl-coenzyme A carboxylase carboxyl transferase subunit alpha n=1 Tax=Desulfotomaculum copahuensis TaxID=1838280 RepID=A0A1B7LGZ0_9FIRM|nr:acetyl-CoA carboxylase carboxyltransferase subunit alpha [Desulfotomaculum copahuensis]OAT85453.1 acetyl-CoA carboxylase carboxyltransferase subunit alpha [Desulfotomaculum copahuensis]
MTGAILEFDRPIVELEEKIKELRQFAREKEINLDAEIANLEKRVQALKENIYQNLAPWQKVLVARHPERPNMLDYINRLCTDFVQLHGDRLYGDDPALAGGIARFDGRPVTVLGQIKGRDTRENLARNFGMAHPEGYRMAMRLMRQAEKFHRPVLAFIDTPGAYPGMGAEERGISNAIAECIQTMLMLEVPVLSVIIGEGGSGGALALASGDCILIQEHAVFSVISPEAYASILWKDSSRAREAAGVMKITAADLEALHLVDEVIPEPLGGAHHDPDGAAERIREVLSRRLPELAARPVGQLLAARGEKFRRIGDPRIYLTGNDIT